MWLTRNSIYGLVSFGSFHPPTCPWLVKQGRDEIDREERVGKEMVWVSEKNEMDLVMLLGCWRWWGDKRWRIWDGGDGSGEKTSSYPVSWIPTAQIKSAPHLVQRQHESLHLTYDAPHCKFQVQKTPIILPKVISTMRPFHHTFRSFPHKQTYSNLNRIQETWTCVQPCSFPL